ncbi:LysR family transcriptional regulator [Hyphomicrobium sp. CS1GBMeth3]|uniref:LysR family transcriptional regulator n=1 Tax=Hyphomicrobium sp. CS1GBMeth3 TaxID=1892845 RepID=UPI000930EC23|nr:LysR family transcriptional regulator [Hyphomicrobium sp. CS1GBMeth3]
MFSRFVRYFDEVARRGSIRRAAEHLNVSPSAIDRQLLQAEEELGVPLFERLPRGLRLTAAGEILVYGVRRWQRDLSRMKFEIEELRGLRRGEVSLAVAEGTTGEFVPYALASFVHDHPRINLRVIVTSSERVWQMVMDGQADVGITFDPKQVPGLRIEHAVKFYLGAIVKPGHPFASLESVKLSDCVLQPLILPDSSVSLRGVIDSALVRTNVDVRPVMTVNSIALIKMMVAQGCGVGLLTDIDAMPEIRMGQLVYVPLADQGIPPSSLSLIVAPERHLSAAAIPLMRYFAVLLEETAQSASDRGRQGQSVGSARETSAAVLRSRQ